MIPTLVLDETRPKCLAVVHHYVDAPKREMMDDDSDSDTDGDEAKQGYSKGSQE
jgi:hypothetical protein